MNNPGSQKQSRAPRSTPNQAGQMNPTLLASTILMGVSPTITSISMNNSRFVTLPGQSKCDCLFS